VGARASIVVGVIAVGIGLLIGTALGLLASARRGWVEEADHALSDFGFAFPAILSAIMMTAVFGPGMVNAIIAIGIYNIPTFARITRASANAVWVARVRAGRARLRQGRASRSRSSTCCPTSVGADRAGTIRFAIAILAEAALSYLGLGTQPPQPSWGRMLSEAQTLMFQAPLAGRLPGRRHCTGGAGPEPAGRRPARPARPAPGPQALTMPLLEVRDLGRAADPARAGAGRARRELLAGARRDAGLVGESGCGKSITAMALMGLLPENAKVTGSIRSTARSWWACRTRMCALRGDRIGMVFQEPMTALNPVHTIGHQVAEPLRLHRGMSAARRARKPSAAGPRGHPRCGAPHRRLSAPVLRRPAPARHHRDGAGLRARPADRRRTHHRAGRHHPAQILDLIRELVAERGMALILISHDLGVIAQNVRRMLVMYGGSVVESGPTAAGVRQPHASVHAGAVRRAPGLGTASAAAAGHDSGDRAGAGRPAERLSVRGPLPLHDPSAMLHRCRRVRGGSGPPSCIRPAMCIRRRRWRRAPAPRPSPGGGENRRAPAAGREPVRATTRCRARSCSKPPGQGARAARRELHIEAGRSLGIVGESGSGKSTLARLVMALDQPTAGQRALLGRDLHALPREELRQARRDFQMVFQDPYGSLDPRQTVERIVTEPLSAQGGAARRQRQRAAKC
jgi:peptide/nickel transport system ATP-binding protein